MTVELIQLEKWLNQLNEVAGRDIDPRRALLDFLETYAPADAWGLYYERYVVYIKFYKKRTKKELIQYWKMKGKSRYEIRDITGISYPTLNKYWLNDPDLLEYTPMVDILWSKWEKVREVLPEEIFKA